MFSRCFRLFALVGTCLIGSLVVGQESENRMIVLGQRVAPGQSDARIPVIGTSAERVDAYQIAATFDPAVLTPLGAILGSAAANLRPEFVDVILFRDRVEVGVLSDFVAPFDGRSLSPLMETPLVALRFDVAPGATPGTRTTIDLVNDLNLFIIAGFAVLPELTSAVVSIVDGTLFIRGDTDSSSEVDMTDAVVMLDWLFLTGAIPACDDSADRQAKPAQQGRTRGRRSAGRISSPDLPDTKVSARTPRRRRRVGEADRRERGGSATRSRR